MLNPARSAPRGRGAPSARSAGRSGFTLIEMMITIVVMSILAALAMPSMLGWVRNGKVRTVAESLQTGLRLAQTESLRRSRQVSFSLTDSKPTTASAGIKAKVDGLYWATHALPSMAADEPTVFMEAGVLTDVGSGAKITGPAVICFNSVGRLVANDSEALKTTTGGPVCAPGTASTTYNIDVEGADRPLRVVVALGGQVRMCDPSKTLSASKPDGCAS